MKDEISILARLSLLTALPLSGLAQSGVAPILPQISEHFSAVPNADVLVRLMQSGLSFAMIAGAMLGGLLGDRLGRRRVLIWTMLAYGIAGTSGYFLDNLYVLILSRFLLGVVIAAGSIMVGAIFATRIGPLTREKWIGFMMVAGTVGSILLFYVIGVVAKQDWRNVFLLHALAFAVVLLIVTTVPREEKSPQPATAPTVTPQRSAPGGIPIGLMLFGATCGMFQTGYQLFLPYHLKIIGLGGPELMSRVIMVLAIAGAVVSFCYGWIRARLSVVQIFMLGFAMVATGMAITVVAKDFSVVVTGMVIVGAGVGLLGPNLFSASSAVAPAESRARSIGFARAGVYAGPLIAQLPLEPLVHSAGPTAAMVAFAGFGALMIVIAALCRPLFRPYAGERAA